MLAGENEAVSVVFGCGGTVMVKAFYVTKLLLYSSFKQKASFCLFLCVLVHISRLPAFSVAHLAHISQREHREFTVILFLGS